ncbi:MAG TPA: molybdate ABC transporter substrate-binding protein [Acidimicrobiia bacterium]|nr:molybdate ABC transporter substrate-binding protein [Acidimicrobiia bacterium]
MPPVDPSTPGRRVFLLIALQLALTACGSAAGDPTLTSRPDDLFVSAAASLTDAFAEVGSAVEEANPGVRVLLNLGSSSSLRQQILEGAPVDVFASADTANMAQIVESGETAADPEIFARNTMQIAFPAGNPAGITGLGDFADEDLLIGLCAATAPCGAHAREVLENAGVIPSIDSNEPDVRALLNKVGSGELDAGIVYQTDVLSSGDVEGLAIPDDVNVIADYPIAVIVNGSHPMAGSRFVEFVLSEGGQAILNRYGFSSP